MRRIVAISVAILCTLCALSGANAVSLKPGVPIIIDPAEPGPVHKAVQDLQRDLKKTFGASSPIVNSIGELDGTTAIVVTGSGKSTRMFRDVSLDGRESHTIYTKTVDGITAVVLQGADMRGTIYGHILVFGKVP